MRVCSSNRMEVSRLSQLVRGSNIVISESCCSYLVEDLALHVVMYLLASFTYFEFINVESTISVYFVLHLFEFVH